MAINAEIARRRTAKGSDLKSDEVDEVLLEFSNLVFDSLSDAKLEGVKSDIRANPDLEGFEEAATTLVDGKLALRRLRARGRRAAIGLCSR